MLAYHQTTREYKKTLKNNNKCFKLSETQQIFIKRATT